MCALPILELMQGLAAQVGTSLEAAEQMGVVENRGERLRVLAEVATMISSRATPDEIQDACLDGMTRVIDGARTS